METQFLFFTILRKMGRDKVCIHLARLENPEKNFMPCPGMITDIHLPGGRVDPALDRMPGDPDIFLAHRERLTGGDPDLLLDEIHIGDRLRYRVFHLDPRVPFG